ncbi:3'-5' exonuclease [Capnocytophaga gingivalis]
MNSFVALDFETANQYRSSVCSIGLVFVENNEIIDTYYQLIKPAPNFYSYFNTQVHGLSQYDTEKDPLFPEVWKEILPKIKDLPLVAHNSMFDEGCLREVLAYYALPQHTNPFFCTLRAARKSLPHLVNHKLDTVSAYFGFDLKQHHHALADAEACAHIALELFK